MQYDTVFFAALNALAIFEGGGNLVDLNIRKVKGGKSGIGHLFFFHGSLIALCSKHGQSVFSLIYDPQLAPLALGLLLNCNFI